MFILLSSGEPIRQNGSDAFRGEGNVNERGLRPSLTDEVDPKERRLGRRFRTPSSDIDVSNELKAVRSRGF